VRRGHDVTCAWRGVSGDVPDGARHVVWDRTDPDVPADLASTPYDAVVDVCDQPGWVRRAVAALGEAHWVFVSTINVYADDSTPGGTPETLPLREPVTEDEQGRQSPELYGGRKVTCERTVLDGAASAMVVRPGLIVGPGDPTGRFSYWPARMADGGEVLAPGSPDDVVQVIDVRDLATWIVDAAEARTTGVFDGTCRPMPRADFLADVAEGVGTEPELTWIGQEFLAEQEVAPWMGPRSIPLWLPLPEYAGLMAHDVTASYDAGLATRPLADTARDTLAWLRDHPDAASTGLTRDEEAAVLRAWRDGLIGSP
jgi:2'-hydroxyisoflavone reductase